MSCQCAVCTYTIAQPDSIWFGTCEGAIFADYVCGTCLSAIPVAARTPTQERQRLHLTFGPYAASANESGIYQFASLRQMEPRFWVPAEVLEQVYGRACELMRDHFPRIAMARFLRELVEAARDGLEVPGPWEGKSRHELIMAHCYGLEEFLGLPHPPPLWEGGEPFRVVVHHGPSPPPSPEAVRRVEAIWRATVKWSEGGGS